MRGPERGSLTCRSFRCRPVRACPPLAKRGFRLDEVMFQTASEMTLQQIAGIAQRFGLSILTQQTIGMLGRTVYTFRIVNGRSVREVIRAVEAAGLNVAVQPNYTYGLTQDRSDPKVGLGDPAQ